MPEMKPASLLPHFRAWSDLTSTHFIPQNAKLYLFASFRRTFSLVRTHGFPILDATDT
jgi:hypothetical protein